MAFKDEDWKRAFLRCMGAALILHLIAVTWSVGFYHTDEHFQILEFLNFKLGRSTGSELAIEFGERIRPWLQPAMDYVIARILMLVGITNPFDWTWVFRFVSGFLGWLSLVGLSILSYSWFENAKLRKLALLLCATLWYLPALHARQSSESLSGSVFYIAVSLLFLFAESQSLLLHCGVGLLLGAAFEFRYQVGFLVMGVFFFYLWKYRPQFKNVTALVLGILFFIALGTWVDHWGYGQWTFAPWNYFHYNLILGHVADVDTQPIWDFFRSSITETFPPLGFLTLCSFALGWIFMPLAPLTWITFPLYLIHSLIGHKELRFIFPIVDAGPFLILLAASAPHRWGHKWMAWWQTKFGTSLFKLIFAINLVALIPTTLLPVWMPARFFSQLYSLRQTLRPESGVSSGFSSNGKMEILYKDKNPFEILGIPLGFYRPPQTDSTLIRSYEELNQRIDGASGPVWYFQVGFDMSEDSGAARTHCKLEIESMPHWMISVIHWKLLEHATQRVRDWALYRCEK
jgi:phosphatidylinositol glycan class B